MAGMAISHSGKLQQSAQFWNREVCAMKKTENGAKHVHHHKNGGKPCAANVSSNKETDSYVSSSGGDVHLDEQMSKVSEHIIDAKNMSPTGLRQKYKLTYTSWRGMKQRCKKQGLELDQAFSTFAGFLASLPEPRTAPEFTLDRIDFTKGYLRENVRWASKTIQGQNKSNVIMLTYKGKTAPLVVFAKMTNQSPDTLRKRHNAGWTDEEVIEGKKSASGETQEIWNFTPWPLGKRVVWEKAYRENRMAGEHRVKFYYRYSKLALDRMHVEVEDFDPNENPPKEWNDKYQRFLSYFRDAKKKLEAFARYSQGTVGKKIPIEIERRLYEASYGKPPSWALGAGGDDA